jgi:hypothetical protein
MKDKAADTELPRRRRRNPDRRQPPQQLAVAWPPGTPWLKTSRCLLQPGPGPPDPGLHERVNLSASRPRTVRQRVLVACAASQEGGEGN